MRTLAAFCVALYACGIFKPVIVCPNPNDTRCPVMYDDTNDSSASDGTDDANADDAPTDVVLCPEHDVQLTDPFPEHVPCSNACASGFCATHDGCETCCVVLTASSDCNSTCVRGCIAADRIYCCR